MEGNTTLRAPYLEAIQAVPGDTPGEKFRWIANLIKDRVAESNLEAIVESKEIQRPLVPFIQIEAAKVLNKKNRESQSNYEAIAEALKSEDSVIVNRALQSKNFFDGSNKNITNVEYFFDHLFPDVSLNARKQIIKTLALRLAPKEPKLAEEFFTVIASAYGMEEALPLLPACTESFVYNTVVTRKIALPTKIVKVMFKKNPDFVVRYLRLSKPRTDSVPVRHAFVVDIENYTHFLPRLIKKRLESFVELYEMHEERPPVITLSNKCSEAFLKNGKEYFQRKPKLYIDLLPLKMINASTMTTIFPKLLPQKIKEFRTDSMLDYLKYYHQDKKLDLLLKSYQEVYKKNLLDERSNVTYTLMKLLPAEERVKQARIKIQAQEETNKGDYLRTWRCYLPANETLPEIRKEIATTSVLEDRAALACQMIYTCKVNGDDAALLDILRYIRDRHKNEQSYFIVQVFDILLEQYDLPQLNEDLWVVITDMQLRLYVKGELKPINSTNFKLLEAAIHFRFLHNLPLDRVLEMFVDVCTERHYITSWNIIRSNPEYERKCLELCLDMVSKKPNLENFRNESQRLGVLYDLAEAMYVFNSKHVKRNSKVEPMTIKNYPWLRKELETVITENKRENNYFIQILEELFRKNEKDLYERFWPKKETIADVESGDALKLLRKNPEKILENWREYFKLCQSFRSMGKEVQFLRAIRWYKDIPLKFVELCVESIQTDVQECLNIMAVLLHGETYAKFIEPLLPTDNTLDIKQDNAKATYWKLFFLCNSMMFSNPPVPLWMVEKMCEGDTLSQGLMTLINVCRRTALPKVVIFAKKMSTKRVSVRKHGIRLMQLVALPEQFQKFLLSKWKTEEHYSIREVLLNKACDLLRKNPDLGWPLLNRMMGTFTVADEKIMNYLFQAMQLIPNDYISDFIKLLLETICRLEDAGLPSKTAYTFISNVLNSIGVETCNILSDEFNRELLSRFLFHPDQILSTAARKFAISSYLSQAGDNMESRLKTFSDIFLETVQSGWNVPLPQKSYYYPVNHGVKNLINDLINSHYVADTNTILVEGVLKTYLSVLKPEMAPDSYLLLIFAKEHAASRTPKEFGLRIADKLPELLDIFTPLFMPFLMDVLNIFLRCRFFHNYVTEDIKFGVMEGLLEAGSIHCAMMAAQILHSKDSEGFSKRLDQIVKQLSKFEHPAIKSAVCEFNNNIDPQGYLIPI